MNEEKEFIKIKILMGKMLELLKEAEPEISTFVLMTTLIEGAVNSGISKDEFMGYMASYFDSYSEEKSEPS